MVLVVEVLVLVVQVLVVVVAAAGGMHPVGAAAGLGPRSAPAAECKWWGA